MLPLAFLYAWVSKQAHTFLCFIVRISLSGCMFKLCSTTSFIDFKVRHALNLCYPLPVDKKCSLRYFILVLGPHSVFLSPVNFCGFQFSLLVSLFKTGSVGCLGSPETCFVDQVDLQLRDPLPLTPEGWD